MSEDSMWYVWCKRLATHQGRLSRLQYLGYSSLLYLLLVVTGLLAFGLAASTPLYVSIFGISAFICMFGFACYSGVCITVRRLHDMDLSGWWYAALIIINIAGGAAMQDGGGAVAFLLDAGALVGSICLLVVPGTDGPNRYDPVETI